VTDDRDLSHGLRTPGECGLVAEQDRAFGGRGPGEGDAVDLLGVSWLVESFEGSDPGGQDEQAAYLAVDRLFLDVAGADRLDEGIAPGADRAGHREVLGVLGALDTANGGPVADHDAVETPVRVQRRLEQLVLGGGGAVDRVVRAHHQPGVGLGDGLLEGEQIDLAQGPLVDHDVRGEALGLEVVGDVVLGRRADAELLDAGDVRRGKLRGQDRVLAEGLEVPATQRRSMQVDRRAEDDVDVLPAGLERRDHAVPMGDVEVPGR
jgi:hypothetical protein